ncbi:hypothetical protein F4780DRAFT_776854 [Xylariomycetidae sp. FL0641]|nr:hypothetical protein F4780DRAFT_776854 [Xylariomycetidae sp. FL0641]
MRSFAALSLLGLAAMSQALEITFYDGDACNAEDGAQQYWIYDFETTYPDGTCIPIVADAALPEGVTCSQYSEAGGVGPEACSSDPSFQSRLFVHRWLGGACYNCYYYADDACTSTDDNYVSDQCSGLYAAGSFYCALSNDRSVCAGYPDDGI